MTISKIKKFMPKSIKEAYYEWRIRNRRKRRLKDYKVVGIGLSRTGTASLSAALERLGFRSIHFRNLNKILGPGDINAFDAFADTPACTMYKQVYRAFPNSKFIYTDRDIKSWVKSMRSLTGAVEPDQDAIDKWTEKCVDSIGYFEGYNRSRLKCIHNSLYANFKTWKKAFLSHKNSVTKFFEKKDNTRLLRMNILEGEGWDKLCPFLNKETPYVSFPHAHNR
jgi:hypothetical protein